MRKRRALNLVHGVQKWTRHQHVVVRLGRVPALRNAVCARELPLEHGKQLGDALVGRKRCGGERAQLVEHGPKHAAHGRDRGARVRRELNARSHHARC